MTNDPAAEKPADDLEQRAEDYCHDALYLGTDGDGHLHFWSRVHQMAIVFADADDRDPLVVALPVKPKGADTAVLQLADWRVLLRGHARRVAGAADVQLHRQPSRGGDPAMTQHCQVAQRRRAEHAAAVLQARGCVLDVATVGPSDDPTDRWVVDVALADDAGGLPPQVCTDLGHLGLTVWQVAPQGGFWQALLRV